MTVSHHLGSRIDSSHCTGGPKIKLSKIRHEMKSLCLKHIGSGLKEEKGAHILGCLTKGRGLEVSLSGVSEVKGRASYSYVCELKPTTHWSKWHTHPSPMPTDCACEDQVKEEGIFIYSACPL